MSSRTPQLACLVALLLGAALGWTQTAHYAIPAASVQDDFAAYHAKLNRAAQNLLAAGAVRPAAREGKMAAAAGRTPNAALVRQFAQQYWNQDEDNVLRALERMARLRPILEPILREQNVPLDVAAVVLVESGGRPTALSPKGARGLWQFMPETARRYGLVVAAGRDDRIDALQSTRAAARYLRDLYAMFGDWSLALAAYNAGERTIRRALDRSRTQDFENLVRTRLIPEETRNYVPAVLSAVRLLGGTLQPPPGTTPALPARVLYAEAGFTD